MEFDWSWWKIAYWAVGTFGVAGTIAIAVFAPQVFAIALKAVVRFFTIVLSYRLGCALVAAALAAFIADYHRHSIEDAKHADEVAAFEKKQDERDKRIAQETRDLVWIEIANATAENTVTDKEVKDFTDALPPSPANGNAFRIGADACRLRQIFGQPECGPQRAQGVPKADAGAEGVTDRRDVGLSGIVRRSRRRVE